MPLSPKNLESLENAGDDLAFICHRQAHEAGWWTVEGEDIAQALCREPENQTEAFLQKSIIGAKLALVHSEISEALEGSRKNLMDDHLPHRTMLEVELADAIIRIADLAGALNLDLGGAIAEKMAYNARRPDHKPEARAAAGGKTI